MGAGEHAPGQWMVCACSGAGETHPRPSQEGSQEGEAWEQVCIYPSTIN